MSAGVDSEPDGPELVEDPEEKVNEAAKPRLRRGLFGYKAADVQAELDARDAEAEELRDDVAALWLVFNQHERAIRELIGAVERLGGGRIAAPGERQWDDAVGEAERSNVPETWMAEQMEGLDDVLAAIRQATEVLERGYEGRAGAVDPAPSTMRPATGRPAPAPLPTPRPRSGSRPQQTSEPGSV